MMKTGEWKKFHQDNRGGAMAMVLIIIAFISILASVLMFASYSGYQMRIIDKQGTDNFYSAETVLDEINAGLQIEVSNALSKSYQQVMVNYALYETAEERSQWFYKVYTDELKAVLADASNPNQYSITKLRGYLSDNVLGDGIGGGVAPDGSKANFGTYGAIVESNVSSGAYTLVVQSDGIVLKDLKVSYVNKSGYISIISTDIHIVLPAANFAQSSAFPSLNGYSLIADETLAMGTTLPDGEITVKGDAYAGKMFVGKIKKDKDDEYETVLPSSIRFEKWTEPEKAEDATLATVISREDIEVVNGSEICTEKVELWGKNLILESAKANLQGSTNLKDDLVLNGTDSTAVLTGEYAGFGIAEDGAELSSAIVVNGKDSLLDLSGVTSMNISGRTYVATAAKEGETNETVKKNTVDVTMGQSIAVKSNQLVYLVPPEALGCVINTDGSVGESRYGCNPLKQTQYEEIINNPEQYVLLDGTKQIASLGYKSLNNYIKQEDVAGEVTGSVTKAYVPEVVFKPTNGETLVYCYLRFKDEESANQYFADYYNVNAAQVDAFTKLYAKEIKLGNAESILYLAGNALRFSGETGALEPAKDSYAQKQEAKNISITKSDIFKALSAKMVTNIAQLSSAEQGHTAFTNIIYRTRVEEVIDKFDTYGSGFVQIDTTADAPENVKSVILSKEEYVVDDSVPSSVHMIISLKDVTVKRDFEGLIISAEDIIVENSLYHDVEIHPVILEEFEEMLNARKADVDGKEYFVLDVFRDGVNYSDDTSAIKDIGTETISMSDLIIYERWSKR